MLSGQIMASGIGMVESIVSWTQSSVCFEGVDFSEKGARVFYIIRIQRGKKR